MSNRLFCGASRRLITPSRDLIPDLRGLRDSALGGVLDDIFVRVIAVGDGESKALLIAFDLDKAPYPAENFARIYERTGVPEANIFFLSTHTHTAPVTGLRPEEVINDVRLKTAKVQAATARYEEQVTGAMLDAVEEAIGGMRAARMGYAQGKSYINVNRNQIYEYTDESGRLHRECGLGVNAEAAVDRTLFVMKFEDMDGRPIAFFMNYATHNCVMIGNRHCDGKMGISGDLSGAVCRLLEERFSGSTAMWSSGAAGDVNPAILGEVYYPDPETGRSTMCLLTDGAACALAVLAGRHFADVMKTVRGIVCAAEATHMAGTVAWSLTPGREVVKRDDGTVETRMGEGVDPFEVRLHLLVLGDVALYGFSGELYSSLGAKVKEISPLKNTVIINHDASLIARSHYIFDDETLACDVSDILPGLSTNRIVPGHVAESLEKHTLEMFKKLGK